MSNLDEPWPYGYGFCCCGCGEKTNLASQDHPGYGWRKGEPLRFFAGHGTATSWAALPKLFWSRVNRGDSDECWPWTGRIVQGYGQIGVEGKQYRANRIAYTLTYGEIPDGLMILHSCNNPGCCNPAHLRAGTNQDNMDDKVRADRQARGERIGNSVLTDAQALDVYARCVLGEETQEEIAADYGINQTTVSDIYRGRTRAWLTGAGRRSNEE